MINMLVGHCHVGQSYVQVLRYVISNLKEGMTTWRQQTRDDRRQMISEIIEAHNRNRGIYEEVMRTPCPPYLGS